MGCSYPAEVQGVYVVSVKFQDAAIKGSPFTCSVSSAQREEVTVPADATATVLDGYKNLRGYVSAPADGCLTCYNKYNDVIGYINTDEHFKGGEVGSPEDDNKDS